jgi:hypothetical protein
MFNLRFLKQFLKALHYHFFGDSDFQSVEKTHLEKGEKSE